MSETILTYFFYLPFYPLVVVFYSLEMGILHYLIGWVALGSVIAYLVRRTIFNFLFPYFFVVWFMPGTIICGSATVVPWATTIPFMFNEGGCVSWFSLIFNLAANTAVVFIVRFLYLKYWWAKKNA